MNLFNMTSRFDFTKIKLLIFFIFLLISLNVARGQNLITGGEFQMGNFPKSPEATAMSKNVDIPSTTHTGVMTIEIPLYEFNFEGERFPVSLTYSTNGIKLDEISSRVGLGWSLNVGGISLSKQVMGTPDHDGYQKYILNHFSPDGAATIDINTGEESDAFKALEMIGHTLGEFANDLEPDIYSYSVFGNSGQFIMDFRENKGLVYPYTPIKIEKINNMDFKMVNEKGFIFDFDLQAFNEDYNSCTSSVSVYRGYKNHDYRINKIGSPNNNFIHFNYEYESGLNSFSYGTSVVQKNVLSNKVIPGFNLPLIPPTCYNSSTNTGEKILREINFPEGKIEFKYSKEYNNEVRQDLVGDIYLKRILVKDLHGNTLKDYLLDIKYFISSGSYNYTESYNKGNQYRLKLEGVTEQLSGRKYELDYYPGNLPPRLTDKKDYWGVYNGANNASSIGSGKYYHWAFLEWRTYNSGNNLLPSYSHAITSNLKSIKYPEGGSMNLTYELDDFIIPSVYQDMYNTMGLSNGDVAKTGTLRISKVELKDENGVAITKEYKYINPLTGKTSGKNYGSFNLEAIKTDVIVREADHMQHSRLDYNYATNNPGWNLTTVNGKSVGYTHVQEIIINKDNASKNHKIEYEYHHDRNEYEDIEMSYNSGALINLNYPLYRPERGLLTTKRYYDNNQNIIKKDSLEYEFNSYFNVLSSGYQSSNALFQGYLVRLTDAVCAGGCHYTFDTYPFYNKTFWIQNTKTTTTDYFNGEPKIITEQITNYSPNPPKHIYPVNTINTNSLGETLRTDYSYPQDGLHWQTGIMNQMIEKNMI
ncbi:hypothetical protein, partial [Moheibacter sediminis]